MPSSSGSSTKVQPDGEKIKIIRQKRRLSRPKLAAGAGLDEKAIKKIEAGEFVVESMVTAVASFLQVEPSEIIRTPARAASLRTILRRAWHDPVGSKVI